VVARFGRAVRHIIQNRQRFFQRGKLKPKQKTDQTEL
jgi:hypothetical protein